MADQVQAPAPAKDAAPPAPARESGPSASSPSPPVLEVRGLHVTYTGRSGEPVEAVRDVSLSIPDKPGAGEIIVFLGPSGCGKSTVLKCVAGLLEPTKGTILAKGEEVRGTSRDRGMVFQQYTSFAWLTVRQNVEYGLRVSGVAGRKRREAAEKVLEQVGLAKFADRYPKDLSGGMKQRVAIARTLVNNPRLLLMDEPFGALDPQTRWSMQTLLLKISREADNTILFVTHDVSEAVYLADTMYIMGPRPTTILHRLDVPQFGEHNLALKQSSAFAEMENKVLALLHGQPGDLAVR